MPQRLRRERRGSTMHSTSGRQRRRSARRLTSGVVAAVAVFTLGACGGGDGDGSSSPTTQSLLQGLFGPSDPAAMAEQSQRVEEAVATCMKALGWEYTPANTAQYMPSEEQMALYSDQYAFMEKWGYGVSTTFGREEEIYGQGFDPESPPQDPNADYVQSLSAAEQEQYYADLYGAVTMPEEGTDDTVAAPTPEEMGCYGKASDEVMGANPLADPEVSESLMDMYTEMESDPRVAEADEKWRACMSDAGFDYDKQDAIYEDLQTRMNALTGSNPFAGGEGSGDAGEGEGDMSPDATTGIGIGDGWTSPSTRTPPADELKALQDEEMAIAKADIACTKKHLEKVRAEVQREFEQRFIDANPAVAERLQQQEG